MQVCRRLDGLPLAIELAAARLRALSLSQLAARLDDQLWLLTGASRIEGSRHRTLEAVVAWSYEPLSEAEQRTFARLAVFPDHFTLEMAETVVSEPGAGDFDIVDIVSRLVDKSLVTTVNMATEADRLLRRVGMPMGVAHNVEGRGIIAFERGEFHEAASLLTEAIQAFASYGNTGCTAHALEAAAVVIATASHDGDSLAAELLAAAEHFRQQSGQDHRPWEVRASLEPFKNRIVTPDATADTAARALGRRYTLSVASMLAAEALQSIAASTPADP